MRRDTHFVPQQLTSLRNLIKMPPFDLLESSVPRCHQVISLPNTGCRSDQEQLERQIMRPEFSEFSYGFAFTHEYINRNSSLQAAPELPSLIREAEKGYDLKLAYQGHAKFFQFKLSEYLSRNTAIPLAKPRRTALSRPGETRPRPHQNPGTDQHSLLKRPCREFERSSLRCS